MVLNNNELPRLAYSTREAATMLQVSEKTILRLLERKKLHALKALRHKRITKKSLEAFLASASGEVDHE